MIEKLLENWLDSASERSYQPVFVQLLAAEGYKVLHSTRHCLLEFGKDVLAIAPDGVGCAFQLKGAPKGRMTIGEFRREIQPQLVQLMSQAPSYPGFPSGPHRAYLVSNGQFEEEVQAAVREMNMMPYPAKVELWSRGTLFELCQRNGAALWPGELEDNRSLLEIYMADPRDQLPVEMLSCMLSSVLKISPEHTKLTGSELSRAISSATWLTGISISTFAERENHQAVALAWTLCAVSLIGAAERHSGGDLRRVSSSLELAKMGALDGLSGLWKEIEKRKHLVEGDAMTDPEVHGWRMSVLYGLLSCLAHADAASEILDRTSRDALHDWLKKLDLKGVLWGEASVAYLLPWMLWLRKSDATSAPDELIALFAEELINKNQPKALHPLPSPYYAGEAVLRYLSKIDGKGSSKIPEEEKFSGGAYMAEILMHLIVRTNQKGRARALWPGFSRIAHERFGFDCSTDYCLFRAPTGVNETKIYPLSYEWGQLRSEVLSNPISPIIPDGLRNTPWLLCMWWQVAPHRVNVEAVFYFAESVLPRWGA